MLPQYSSIPNQDNEKQAHHGYSCPCAAATATNFHQCQFQQQRKRPSKWTIITLGVLGYLFISHISDYHCNQKNDELAVKYHEETNDPLVNNQGWGFHCWGPDSPTIPWSGQAVYESSNPIKSLTLNHDRSSNSGYNIYSKGGKFVVEQNSELSKPRVTFDIKVSNNDLQDTIEINEFKSVDDLKLVLHQGSRGRQEGCILINALVELPTSDALSDISFDLINDNIIIEDELNLNGSFTGKTLSGDIRFLNTVTAKEKVQLETASGDIRFFNKVTANEKIQLESKSGDIVTKDTASSSSFDLKTASGDIHGHFGFLNEKEGDFNANAKSGDVDIVFDSISSVSTINAKAVSGDVDIKLPSDFESQFEIVTISGDVKVEAKNAKDLHATKIKRRRFKSIKGYYGNDENSASVIKASATSGDVGLKYN
ncbi:unnamed protein product [Cunninghamella blakesleeana]